jgi:hypothetical protein
VIQLLLLLLQLLLLFCSLLEALTFRFNVFGGKLRFLLDSGNSKPVKDKVLKTIVTDSLNFFFPDASEEDKKWAVAVLLDLISSKKKNEERKQELTLSNLFFSIADDSETKVFCSTFMGILASRLLKATETSIITSLKKVIGCGGIGNASEFCFHENIIHCGTPFYGIVNDEDLSVTSFDLTGMRVKNIQTLEGIEAIGNNEYGIPTISNFPVIDSVAMKDNSYYCFQSTISLTHGLEVPKWEEIFSILKKKPECRVYFVWVLDTANIELFSFNASLPENVIQVKMFATPCTQDVLSAVVLVSKLHADKVFLISV